jgi:hypothetical protein
MPNASDLQSDLDSLRPIKLPLKTGPVKVMSALAAVLLISAFAQLGSDPILAVIGIPFMALLLLIVVKLWRSPERTFLVLDGGGITHSALSKRVNIRWSEIRKICAGWPEYLLYEVPWNKHVLIYYRDDDQDKRLAISPRMFGMSADRLVAVMTRYYESARNTSRT